LKDLFTSGHAIDFVLLVIFAEFLWLMNKRRLDLVSMILPGIFLLIALRSMATGSVWWQTAMWIALSLPFHLYDLRRRLA